MSTTNTENQPKIEENHAQKEMESATVLKVGVQPKKKWNQWKSNNRK